jgi:Translation initiation factor IF-2, N-terminal region
VKGVLRPQASVTREPPECKLDAISAAHGYDRQPPAAAMRQCILPGHDNYDCRMLFSEPLDRQLRQIALSEARSRREPPGGIMPADPQDDDVSIDERRAGCLGLLRVYTRMIKILQRRIDVTVDAALTYGATYGQVAAACGVSRQAARQRWLRRVQRQEGQSAVLIASGPPERGWDRVQASPADPSVSPAGRIPASAAPPPDGPRRGSPGRKVRVYELAKEFGVESTVVMTRLMEMGEFTRSAASTVEAPLIRRLREEFSSQQTAGDTS